MNQTSHQLDVGSGMETRSKGDRSALTQCDVRGRSAEIPSSGTRYDDVSDEEAERAEEAVTPDAAS